MNDISKIIQKIEEETNQAETEIEAAAQREVESILKSYEVQAEAVKSDLDKEFQKKAEIIKVRAASQADIAQRNLKLSYRRAAISEAFELAAQKMNALDRQTYLDFLTKQIAASQSQDGELILNEKDQRELGTELVSKVTAVTGKNLKLAPEAGSFSGGFILREGSIEINSTFEVLIESVKEELESDVAKALFG